MLLFVYGTLRKDGYNHILIENDIKEYKGIITLHNYGLYVDDMTPYPFCSQTDDASIVGELYTIDSIVLARVIGIEVPAGYSMVLSDGMIFFTYEDVGDMTLIEHGDWVKYNEEKS